MAKHKAGVANQCLYFAGFYLDLIAQVEADEAIMNRQALLRAHRYSCVRYLEQAYRGLIWEVAQVSGLTCAPHQSLAAVLEQVEARGLFNAELDRLHALEQCEEGWLSALLQRHEQIQSLDPDVHLRRQAVANLNAIEFRSLTTNDDWSQLTEWHKELRQLLDSVRELLVEW